MGIDVFLIWEGMTREEWDQVSNEASHLREDYHGMIYATWVLIPEGWDERSLEKKKMFAGTPYESEFYVVPVTAKMLRDMLPDVLATALEKGDKVYHENLGWTAYTSKHSATLELAEKKEKEDKKLDFGLIQQNVRNTLLR